MSFLVNRDDDYVDFEDDSDPCEAVSSSEDEMDIILHRTPDQNKKLQLSCRQRKKESDSEDEFEREMNQELNATVKALESQRNKNPGGKSQPDATDKQVEQTDSSSVEQTGSRSVEPSDKFYDDVYFDSDEEEMVTQGNERMKRKHPVVTNDDLLYDPNMDDNDQRWIDRRRQSYQPKTSQSKVQTRRLPQSDAVLDCPACMSTLCLDCQRHDTYHNQYRAMFVSNCSVDKTELLKIPQPQPKQSKKKNKKVKTSKSETEDSKDCEPENVEKQEDMFHPVRCIECNTVVGVYDNDEVYHFFNVLASYG